MAELTEEQKRLIEESIRAAKSRLGASGSVPVIVIGGGTVKAQDSRFQIEHLKD